MLTPDFCDSCVIFGDSITQTSAPGTFHLRLAEYYERRLDVINRGFSGYNTQWGLEALKRFLQTKSTGSKIRLLSIWFGTNDAILSPGTQHVSLEAYKRNLHEMISLINAANSEYPTPITKIILITPPPFLEHFWRKQHIAWALESGYAETEEAAVKGMERKSEVTKTYAEACVAVGKQAGVEVLDVYSGMINAAGSDTEDALRPFFTDGVHLTPEGYDVVFKLFTRLVEEKFPEVDPVKMSASMPDYSQFQDTSDLGATIDQCQRIHREERYAGPVH